MIKHNQDGAVSGLLISLILVVLLLISSAGFGYWAFTGRQDYKNNTDAKIAVAVQVATQKESTAKDAAFAEAIKNPLATYAGPENYGSIIVKYPKTWSAYVDDTGSGSALVDGYFAPGTVPALTGKSSIFALRVQVINQSYSQVLQNLSNQQQSGQVTVSAYALPKVPSVTGVKVIGNISSDTTNVTMVIIPIRSQTLQIWTEGSQFVNDFNNYILPNFSFSP